MLALVYLAAIVAANLTIGIVGPAAVIPVGLLLIGLDLVTRDRLHDQLGAYGRRALLAGMGALIAVGGLLSYGVALLVGTGPLVGRIAIASGVAFTAAALVDAVAYQLLKRTRASRFGASAGSNVPAALVDSFLFLALAFPGPVPLALVAGQFAAKAIGGLGWAVVLYRPRRPRTLAEAIAADLGIR